MALRHFASVLGSKSSGLGALRSLGSVAVYDHIVDFTLVDLKGIRHPMRALEGDKLNDILLEHPQLTENLRAPTPGSFGSWDYHVMVTQQFLEKMNPRSEDEMLNLEEFADEVKDNSRLASSITLTQEMKGLTVALAKIGPWQTL